MRVILREDRNQLPLTKDRKISESQRIMSGLMDLNVPIYKHMDVTITASQPLSPMEVVSAPLVILKLDKEKDECV